VEHAESDNGARNDTAFRRSTSHAEFASTMRSGRATSTAALNWMEFSAMALGISSLSTKVGTSAW